MQLQLPVQLLLAAAFAYGIDAGQRPGQRENEGKKDWGIERTEMTVNVCCGMFVVQINFLNNLL